MTDIKDLKTRAGLLLYRQLPEEYRFLDRRNDDQPGDLESYLHGFGHLLDLIRGTTEQAYADAFADPIDFPNQDIEDNRDIQTWLLPYLAELIGAELLAPDPKQRNDELSNTVGWYKTKGTLRSVDSIADTVSGTETVTVEGWRRVLLTPA
jgi:Phage tail protein (Tail_P2_I)